MPKVLVIDDEEPIRELFKIKLENSGYTVELAVDGCDGLEKFRNNPSDLIITDIIMPEKEGVETIVELRREFPDAKIIAISGGGRIDAETYLLMAKNLGAVKAFMKPINWTELLSAVDNLF